jgi:chromosome segregation ATPase
MTSAAAQRAIPRYPEEHPRAALAEAIDWRDERKRAISENERAVQMASARSSALFGAIEKAAAAVEDAHENAANYIEDEALGRAGKRPQSPKEAREALADAEEGHAAARAARDKLETRRSELEQSLRIAEMNVGDAIAKVVQGSSELAALLARHDQIEHDLAESRAVLGALGSIIPRDVHWDTQKHFEVTADVPWRTALLALRTDANAPLPAL